jgi:two-component system KDP operon response regulator KdpE
MRGRHPPPLPEANGNTSDNGRADRLLPAEDEARRQPARLSSLRIAIKELGMGDRLLVIEPDPSLSARLSSFLQANGFQVLTAADGREGLRIAYEYHPELVILDLVLPDLDGRHTCARLRDLSDLPILMLSKSSGEEAIVACLEAGADDCVGDPLQLGELEARVRALLRRARNAKSEQMPEYDDGRLRIDPQRQLVWRCGAPVHLSPTEFRLLSTLLRHCGSVVSYEDLLAEAWGPVLRDNPNCLSIFVQDIRDKLEEDPTCPQYIQTTLGVGYFFVPNGAWAGYRPET